MAKKKKKTFRAVKAVKELARERIGAVPPTRRVESAKRKKSAAKPKHKPTTGDLLSGEF